MSDLKVGDVVLIQESGYGLFPEDVGKYVKLTSKRGDNWYVEVYDCLLKVGSLSWVFKESFGKNPMILLNTLEEKGVEVVESTKKDSEVEYTGGSSNYYKVFVKNPTTLAEPYEAECNDIIEALKMTFAEGNAFKAIWRKAKARQGVQKKGYDNGLYDSEKVVFFGERMVVEAKSGEGN